MSPRVSLALPVSGGGSFLSEAIRSNCGSTLLKLKFIIALAIIA